MTSLVGQVWERKIVVAGVIVRPVTLWVVTQDDGELTQLVNLETADVKDTLTCLLTDLPKDASVWRRFA